MSKVVYSYLKNFACIDVKTQKKKIYIYLNINFEDITSPLPNIEMEDVSNKGHLGTGGTKIAIKSIDELEAVKYLIKRSYDNS